MKFGVLAIAATLLLGASMPLADESLFNEKGYRSSRYRAPLPTTVTGATTLDALELKQLMEQRRLYLVDVQAVTVRPETAEFGIDWLPVQTRYHLAGSIWLPNVGYAELSEEMWQYFERELRQYTGGRLAEPLVFYCIADCWLSWNAVQRAATFGYSELYWFPAGTDGWEEQGFPLVEATPRPINPES